MAKILISPIGTGQQKSDNSSSREYKTAKYKIDEMEYERSFVSSVLKEHLQIDHIIFIGTVKSMWEEVYRFYNEDKKDFDLQYYDELATKINEFNYSCDLNLLDLDRLEKSLSERSKCKLIYYGLNEEELQKNLEIIINSINNSLEDGDEIFFDITHSFRSLSLYLFLVLMFITDLLKEKKIKVSGVYYGMLDVVREIGHAPVVDLSYLLNTVDLIKASYEFQNYGNGFLIADLLRDSNQEFSEKILNLSKAISMNYTSDIIESAKNLSKVQARIPSPYSHFIPNFINQFAKNISAKSNEYEKEYELAKWHYKNKNMSSAYILLAESIVTYVCEKENIKPIRKEDKRKEAKEKLFNETKFRSLKDVSKKISDIRNNIAHNIGTGNLDSDFAELGNYLAEVKKLF
ncbi:MAG: TIGR02221 family CRISPR-associated protein [Leptospiraceae bacterium]|nr:TIGR02221 family CRISPR-associated protein [Leptospiraceae bacterium]